MSQAVAEGAAAAQWWRSLLQNLTSIPRCSSEKKYPAERDQSGWSFISDLYKGLNWGPGTPGAVGPAGVGGAGVLP